MSGSLGYSIIIREGDFEDGDRFEARVKELPNLLVYTETYEDAYLDIQDLIELTAESCAEDGKAMPVASPITSDSDFSGRITLRLPTSLHETLYNQSKAENVSLNAYISTSLAGSATEVKMMTFFTKRMRPKNIRHLTQVSLSNTQTQELRENDNKYQNRLALVN